MPDKAITPADIINRALMLHLGMPADFSFSDETQSSAACLACYEQTVAECFALTDWAFSRVTRSAARIDMQPENGYKYGFYLPGNRIGQPTRILSNPRNVMSVVRDYTIEADKIYCDEPKIFIRYNQNVDPQYWDAAFLDAFTCALAAKLAIPLQQNAELADIKRQEAFGSPAQGGSGGKFGRLLAQDKAAAPQSNSLYWNDPLTQARYETRGFSLKRW